MVCVNGERKAERGWSGAKVVAVDGVVAVDDGYRVEGVDDGAERPTMADVRLDCGPGRSWGIEAVGVCWGLLDEALDGPSLSVLLNVILVLAVVCSLYIRTPPSRQAVATRSKPRTLKGAH